MIRKPSSEDVPSAALGEALRQGDIDPLARARPRWRDNPFTLTAMILAGCAAGPLALWFILVPGVIDMGMAR